jgi:hypothetical protein
VSAFGDDGLGAAASVNGICGGSPTADGFLADWYRSLGALRNARRALRTGRALYYSTNGDVIGILRYCLGEVDAFGASAVDEMLLTVVNPDAEPRRIVIDLRAEKECLRFDHLAFMCALELTRAVRLLSSGGNGDPDPADATLCGSGMAAGAATREQEPTIGAQSIPITRGLLDIFVPPRCAEIFEIEWERE